MVGLSSLPTDFSLETCPGWPCEAPRARGGPRAFLSGSSDHWPPGPEPWPHWHLRAGKLPGRQLYSRIPSTPNSQIQAGGKKANQIKSILASAERRLSTQKPEIQDPRGWLLGSVLGHLRQTDCYLSIHLFIWGR